MGGGGEQHSSSFSTGESKLSSLALTQENILKNREALFQDYFVPEVKNVVSGFDPDSGAGQAQMGITADQINQSFDAAQKKTDQMIAQRNLDKTGAGAALTAANNRARSSALASAYANQMASSNTQKADALVKLGTLMPQTTTAAPILSTGKSSSISVGASGNFSLL